MKKALLLIHFLLFLIPGVLFAFQVEDISFLPGEFHVGDIVDLRITMGIAPGTFLEIPEEYPEAPWVLIRDITLMENEETVSVHIIFSAYQPGIRVLPPLDLGGVVLEGIKIDTASVLDREYLPFQPAADPLYLSRTGFYFALFLGCIIGVPLLFLLSFRGIRTRIKRAVIAAGRRKPLIRLQKVLRELERKILNRDGNVFYTTLLQELKIYLSARTGDDFIPLTSREACGVLVRLYPEEYFRGTLEELFLFADRVKFGGLDPYTARKKEDLNRAEEAVKALEIYYRHLWAAEDKGDAGHVDS